MEIKEILREIEGFAPLTLAMSWDNVGFWLEMPARK